MSLNLHKENLVQAKQRITNTNETSYRVVKQLRWQQQDLRRSTDQRSVVLDGGGWISSNASQTEDGQSLICPSWPVRCLERVKMFSFLVSHREKLCHGWQCQLQP